MPPCLKFSFQNPLHSFVFGCKQSMTRFQRNQQALFFSLFISMNKFRWTLMFLRFMPFSRGSLFMSVERRLTFPHFWLSAENLAFETCTHSRLLHCSLDREMFYFLNLYVTQVWILFATIIPRWLCVCVAFCHLSEQHLMNMLMYSRIFKAKQIILDKGLRFIWVGLCFSFCKLLLLMWCI